VTIERPEQPLGTHIYTALGFMEDGIHCAGSGDHAGDPRDRAATVVSRAWRKRADREAPAVEAGPASTAAEALERIPISEDAVQRRLRVDVGGGLR